jgi:surfeit locus 1 family protein
MIRRLPLIPTLVVAAAVAAMIWAGVWNLQRAKLHQAELDAYRTSSRLPPVTFPTVPLKDDQLPLYRYATGNCLRVIGRRTSAGENLAGEPGFAVILDCATGAEGPGMSVEVGWSKNPNASVSWKGGIVSGIIVPDSHSRLRLVAASAAPGLAQGKAPTPSVTVSPARNLGYALQWFSFALIALIIYALVMRKKLKEEQAAP